MLSFAVPKFENHDDHSHIKNRKSIARVTEANIDYVGSVTIDEDRMDAANMIENEQVHVL